MLNKWPVIELPSASDKHCFLRFEAVQGELVKGKLVLDLPTIQFFKRITIYRDGVSSEILLDFSSIEALSGHLIAVIEIAKGQGYGMS
jgi:hypothetical protein